jgi:hypothetical protein
MLIDINKKSVVSALPYTYNTHLKRFLSLNANDE